MKPVALLLALGGVAGADQPHTTLEIVKQLRQDLSTELVWSDHKLDVKARLADLQRGDCSGLTGHEAECATPAGRAHVKRMLDDLAHDQSIALDLERYGKVPASASTRLKARIDKLGKSIATLEAGKTDGVYCDRSHTKLDVGDACLELVPANR